MEPVVREVRMAAGNDQIMGPDGAAEILHVLDDYFGPDAVDKLSAPRKLWANTWSV